MGKNKKKGKKHRGKKNNNINNSESKASRRRQNRENMRKIAAQNFGKFVKQLEDLGLRIKEMRGDGNCLFRSVSDQIEGNEENHFNYRQAAIDYMVENKDHFQFFIEDDQSFDDYIKVMGKDGTWGGNLEIYALSMKLNVNFYIHIYNHPMYIVKNFDAPSRNVHLSYHDGEHYNSVRLKDDFENDVPMIVPLELINCVETTTDMNALNDEANLDGEDDEDDEDKDTSTKASESITKEGISQSDSVNEIVHTKSDTDNFVINDTIIKDTKDKESTKNTRKCIMSQEGIIINEIKDFSKCHCDTNKKYKNCCIKQDITGEYDKQENIFYCDLDNFKSKFHYEIKDKKLNTASSDVSTVTKQLDKIFI